MILVFSVAYDGECSECGASFRAGDQVGWIDDQIICENCVRWRGIEVE